MFAKPEVGDVKDLHNIGRQLAVLQRIYQSYVLIIERILDRQTPLKSQAKHTHGHVRVHNIQQVPENDSTTKGNEIANKQNLEVSLSPAATVRFERLKDRINLYALSEIKECLTEKESLVFLVSITCLPLLSLHSSHVQNFNLITLKESHAVERLTRITILLAKVTILFMPVSLMTAYFSVQIDDLEGVYTARTYWICFAVIMSLSFLFLVAFGQLSGTLEGRPIYRSFTETFYDFSRHAIGSRRRRKRH